MKTVTLKVCTLYFFVSLATIVRTRPILEEKKFESTTEKSSWFTITTTTTPKPPANDYEEVKESTTETSHHVQVYDVTSNEEYMNDSPDTNNVKPDIYHLSSGENTSSMDNTNSTIIMSTSMPMTMDTTTVGFNPSKDEYISHTDDQINSSSSSTTVMTPVTVYKPENYDFSDIENISHTDNTNLTIIVSTTMSMPMDNKTENINILKSEKTSHMDDNTNSSMDNKSEDINFFNNFSTTTVSSDYNVLKSLEFNWSSDGTNIHNMYGSLELYLSSFSRISDYIGNFVSNIYSSFVQVIKKVNNAIKLSFQFTLPIYNDDEDIRIWRSQLPLCS